MDNNKAIVPYIHETNDDHRKTIVEEMYVTGHTLIPCKHGITGYIELLSTYYHHHHDDVYDHVYDHVTQPYRHKTHTTKNEKQIPCYENHNIPVISRVLFQMCLCMNKNVIDIIIRLYCILNQEDIRRYLIKKNYGLHNYHLYTTIENITVFKTWKKNSYLTVTGYCNGLNYNNPIHVITKDIIKNRNSCHYCYIIYRYNAWVQIKTLKI